MKFAAFLFLSAILLCAPAGAQTGNLVRHPATAEDRRPNDPKVPDAYAVTAKFDRIVVMRIKNKADLLRGMEQLVRKEGIKDAVILSGIGSLRGYHVHNVASRDYPVDDVFTRAPTTPANLNAMNGYIVNGQIHCHVTMAVGDKAAAISGHLEPGTEVLTFAIVTVGVLDKPLGRVDDQTYR